MPTDLSHPDFNVTPVPNKPELMRVSLKVGIGTMSVEMPTKEASGIAAIVLGAARDIYDQTGKPPPYSSKEQKMDIKGLVSPSGYSIAPGRKTEKLILVFHFGDSALGIEAPKEVARTLAQQLLLSASDEEGKPQ